MLGTYRVTGTPPLPKQGTRDGECHEPGTIIELPVQSADYFLAIGSIVRATAEDIERASGARGAEAKPAGEANAEGKAPEKQGTRGRKNRAQS